MDPVQHLKKYAQNKKTGGTKYYIDCGFFSYNSQAIRESIQVNKLIRNTEEATILQAVATDRLVNKKHRRIVVKMDRPAKSPINNTYRSFAQKEFMIGEDLIVIPGFFKFICVFSCYDDTSNETNHATIDREGKPTDYTQPICQSKPDNEHSKDVLVMPFIQDGSVATFGWNRENIGLLKHLLIQTVLSLAMAYDQIKFIHEDLHTGNLLFKPTQQRKIVYSFSGSETSFELSLDTYNKKMVIMDFGKSRTIMDTPDNSPSLSPRNFWNNIYYLCKHIDDPLTYDDYYITFELQDALDFIRHAAMNHADCSAVIQLVGIIGKSACRVIRKTAMKYSPLP
jgi:serine/threonine protein kinase